MWGKQEVHLFLKNGEVKLKPGLFTGNLTLPSPKERVGGEAQPGKCLQADEMDVLCITWFLVAYKKICENRLINWCRKHPHNLLPYLPGGK